jgi:OOP family OmpA-OmpF porin
MQRIQFAPEEIEMLLKNCGILLAFAGFLLVTPAQADHEHGEGYPFYGGFGLGFTSADSQCDYYSYDCDGTDTAFKIYAGKRVHKNLAFEVAYHDLGNIRDRDSSGDVTARSDGVNFSFLGIIPVSDFGYFYGKAGYMLWDAEYERDDTSGTIDEDGEDFTYGAGFAFTFSEEYDFRLEFERLNEFGNDFVSGGSPVTVFYLSGTINFF